ncbi:hypothetical protein NHQ30_009129 [Ciborinia camelliae]|nr:hypothetical protein NHQ30_009129 [Ciborinia camelliae]
MENNHHSRKRKHTHEHKSRHGESGKHHKHSHHDTANQKHAQSHSHSLERLAERRQPLAIRDQNELSGDNNYVRNWLAQTQNGDIVESLRQPSPRTGKISHRMLSFSKIQALTPPRDLESLEERARKSDYIHTVHKSGQNKDTKKLNLKPNKEHVSSDSSLLGAPTAPIVKETTKTPQKSRAATHGEETTKTHKHQKNAPSTMTSSSSQPSVMQQKQETFEKRPRHKTREDRYDTKKKSNKAEVVEKPIKTRREKKGDRKKAARKASGDLMKNFASNKIGQDRLTTRPSNGPGIFQNGRASSPPRRRGLPDLAFSEMEFLQRSDKKSHVNDTIVVPKSRAKEKKKAARKQDEIATFFKPSKTPIRDNSSTFEDPTSPTSIHEASLYERQLRRDREYDRHQYSTDNLTSRVDNTESNLIESRNQSNHICFPREPTPQFPSEEVGHHNMYSETADTIVTWSESQNSPGATIALRQAREQYCRRQDSATPDSVRSSIERTGIFKDTGIENSSKRKSHVREATSKGLHGTRENHSVPTTDPIETSEDSSRLSIDSAKNSYEIGRPPNFQQQDCLPRPSSDIQRKTEEPLVNRRPPDTVEICDDGRRRIVVEYYDSNRGWYRKEEDPKSPSKSPKHLLKSAEAPIPAPLTRQQMARNARIKRPSTTLPVIREASDESRENSPLSISGISGKEIRRTESAPVQSSSVKGDINGQIPISHADTSERQKQVILKPPVSEQMSLSKSPQFQHNYQYRVDQREITNNTSRNASPPIEVMGERESQPILMRTAYLNGRTQTPLGITSHINPNMGDYQLPTEPHFKRRLRSRHESPRHHIASIPRSPLIRLPSLYVQQLEYEQEQEQEQIANALFNESGEGYEECEAEGSYFNTESYEENWGNVETEQEMSFEVEDVLENRRYIGDLGEIGTQEANVYEDSMSGPEGMGPRYENSGLNFQTDGYQPRDIRGDEYNHWGSGNHYLQEPWIERQPDFQQQIEMDYRGHQSVQTPFPGYRELDARQDGNASETSLMQRFWRPNPRY